MFNDGVDDEDGRIIFSLEKKNNKNHSSRASRPENVDGQVSRDDLTAAARNRNNRFMCVCVILFTFISVYDNIEIGMNRA